MRLQTPRETRARRRLTSSVTGRLDLARLQPLAQQGQQLEGEKPLRSHAQQHMPRHLHGEPETIRGSSLSGRAREGAGLHSANFSWGLTYRKA